MELVYILRSLVDGKYYTGDYRNKFWSSNVEDARQFDVMHPEEASYTKIFKDFYEGGDDEQKITDTNKLRENDKVELVKILIKTED